ncbi:MAG: tetratricopeptide repeat protein [Acidobacteria bacterium]|nr:tetratricopeptide repeat protein [Acidobacteriota bacterium]
MTEPEAGNAPAGAPRGLLALVVALAVAVMGLGAAVVALRVRVPPAPSSKVERDLQVWEGRVHTDPKDDSARVGLGIALLGAGRTADARRALEEALRLNPDNWMALFRLGLLVRESDPERATAMLARAGAAAPRSSKALPFIALGELELARGEAREARQAFEAAVADSPYLIDARVGLARALEALGDERGALEQYREAARYDPSNKQVESAIARLERGLRGDTR